MGYISPYDENQFTTLTPLSAEERTLSHIIAIMNSKGGCAKSYTTYAFAHWLCSKGFNVGVLDTDPQCNLSQNFSISQDDEFEDRRIGALYEGLSKTRTSNAVFESPFSVSYPYGFKLGGALGVYAGSEIAEEQAEYAMNITASPSECRTRFRDTIFGLKNYFHYLLIDTAPSIHNNAINELTINIADEIIIPFDGEEAVLGINQFLEWMYKRTYDEHRPNVLFALTKYHTDPRAFEKLYSDVSLFRKYHTTSEYRCAAWRAMKLVFGDQVCDNGIRERKILKTHAYSALPKSYDMKKKYDAMCYEIYKKISIPRDNTLDIWMKNKLKDKLSLELEPLSGSKHKKVIPTLGSFRYEGLGDQ
jgi:cellulose biosynthesis protein BcsQ